MGQLIMHPNKIVHTYAEPPIEKTPLQQCQTHTQFFLGHQSYSKGPSNPTNVYKNMTRMTSEDCFYRDGD